MKQVTWISLVAFCAMVLTGVSCHRDVFDEERYEELLDSVCPVDSIDKDHSWVLTTAKAAQTYERGEGADTDSEPPPKR